MKTTRYIFTILLMTLVWLTPVRAEEDYEEEDIDIELNNMIAEMGKEAKGERKLKLLREICKLHYNADSTYKYSLQLLSLARELGNKQIECDAYQCLHWSTFFNNDFPGTMKWAYQQIMVADSIGSQINKAKGMMALGNIYSMMMDEMKADEFYQKALTIFTEQKDTNSMCLTLSNIAQSDINNDMFEKAEDCYNKILALSLERNNIEYQTDARWGLGCIALNKYTSNKIIKVEPKYLIQAKKETEESYKMSVDINYSLERSAMQLADIYIEEAMLNRQNRQRWQALMDSSKMMIDKSLSLNDRASNLADMLDTEFIRIKYLTEANELKKSKALLDSIAEYIEKDSTQVARKREVYSELSKIYEKEGKTKEMLEAKELSHYWELKGRSRNYMAATLNSMAQTEYEEKMRVHDKESAEKEAMQKLISFIAIITLIFVSIGAFVAVMTSIKHKRLNTILDAKNSELEEQREEILSQNENLEQKNEQIEIQKKNLEYQNKLISEKNRQTTESLNYASLIQKAAMPSESQLSGIFGDHLLLFRPLNIVSGDYIWATENSGIKMLAVADCTGHGVPGAFLSMLGISILNEIAAKSDLKTITAGQMLDQMRSQLEHSLHQRGESEDGNHDGMDIALIKIDPSIKKLQYAGAFRPLIIIHDGVMKKVDADRMPIGIHYKEMEHFTNHEIELTEGDVIYMFTDGMTDQFGYDDEHNIHKFTSKRLRNLLLGLHKLPFSTQKVKIEMTLDQWRAEGLHAIGELYEQTDDAILVGIRV